MVVGIGLFSVYTIIPLHAGFAAKLILRISGQPLPEDSGVHALKCIRDRADTGEHRPVVSGKLINNHAFRYIAARVFTGNEIPELSAADIVDADAIFPDAVVHQCLLIGIRRSISGIHIVSILFTNLIPEFRDLRVSGFIVKLFLKADDLKREHRCDFAVHLITSMNG